MGRRDEKPRPRYFPVTALKQRLRPQSNSRMVSVASGAIENIAADDAIASIYFSILTVEECVRLRCRLPTRLAAPTLC